MEKELKDYLDRITDEMSGLREEIRKNREGIEKNSDGIHQNRILMEKLDDKIDLVGEGLSSNTQLMYRLHEENRQELQEFRVVIEAAVRNVEGRVSGHDDDLQELGERVSVLEGAKS